MNCCNPLHGFFNREIDLDHRHGNAYFSAMRHWEAAIIAAAVLFCNFVGAPGEDAPSSASGERQLLVLRNGEVLEGHVVRQNDCYLVEFPHGHVRLKLADVELVCKSLEEGYQQKRATIQIGNVHHHLQLAQWCLRHRLWGQAAAELADAAKAEPDNPLIGALRQRLEMAMSPPQPEKQAVASGPTNEELDRMIRSLSPKAVEQFSQCIQPMLLNHCTSSGCHGPLQQDGFRLLRAGASKMPGRRATQRNLYNVLQYVDRQNPLASPLLTIPVAPHGNAQHPIFGKQQAEQYNRLRQWVLQLSGWAPPLPADLPPQPDAENQAVAQAAPAAPPQEALEPPAVGQTFLPEEHPPGSDAVSASRAPRKKETPATAGQSAPVR